MTDGSLVRPGRRGAECVAAARPTVTPLCRALSGAVRGLLSGCQTRAQARAVNSAMVERCSTTIDVEHVAKENLT